MLACPDCNHILTPQVFETDSPGGKVEVDHCTFCAGTWFDHYEINRFSTQQAVEISSREPLGGAAYFHGSNNCPHCGIKLKLLASETIAPTAKLLICPHCRGHWVSKKDLVYIKKYQQTRLEKFKSSHSPLPSLYAVLIPVLGLSIMAAMTFVATRELDKRQQTAIRAKELVGVPVAIPVMTGKDNRNVIVSFSTLSPTTSSIELIGPERAQPLTIPVSTTATSTHIVTITGLHANQTYTYQVIVVEPNGQKTTSETYTFRTP